MRGSMENGSQPAEYVRVPHMRVNDMVSIVPENRSENRGSAKGFQGTTMAVPRQREIDEANLTPKPCDERARCRRDGHRVSMSDQSICQIRHMPFDPAGEQVIREEKDSHDFLPSRTRETALTTDSTGISVMHRGVR